MKTLFKPILLCSLSALAPVHAASDCQNIYLKTKKSVTDAPDRTVEIAASEVASSACCACEIVKASIEASRADVKTVAAIVEAASISAPEQMRLIVQCAIAVAPDALAEVQAVVARLDPNRGEAGASDKDAKSAKSAVDGGNGDNLASAYNPLDFPGKGPVNPGTGPGFPIIPIPPIIVVAPPVTQVNP